MGIYEVLQEIMTVEKCHLEPALFSEDKKNELDNDVDVKIFELLKNVSSIAFKISDDSVEFHPFLIIDGKRTFSIEDLTENDYMLLSSMDLKRVPLNLRARVSDILWVQKRDYKSAVVAAESYFKMFDLWFNDEHWIKALDLIKRAICISAQINKKDIYSKCCQTVYDNIIRIDGKDKDFLSINLIDVILFQSFGDVNQIIDVLNKIVSFSKDEPEKTERAYLLKIKCLNRIKKTADAKQANISLADYFVSFAEDLIKKDVQEALRAEHFLCKAISLYRNNGETKKAEETHRILVDVQKEIPKLMKPFKTTFDTSKIVENIEKNMEGLSFEECVIRLTQMISFYKKDEYKKKVFEDLESYPLSHGFKKNVVNSDGQAIFSLPPLSLTNPSEDESILDLHIHSKMYEFQEISGNMYLGFALSYIKENFNVSEENFDFLIENNAIIPFGRKNIICSAIRMALEGRYYEALHILAPQTENIFRNIAKEVGGLTVTLEFDGTSKEKVLSSIFDLPELKDCYDNDILFLFKGLLNEQAGANIRNNIAHGIMNEYRGSTGACLYFICAVIKLLVYNSRQCIEIIMNKNELQSYVNPESDTFINNEE